MKNNRFIRNDIHLRNTLIIDHINLPIKFIRKRHHYIPLYLHEECLSEAYIGLIRAAELFDQEKSVYFPNYAYKWIRKYVYKEIYKEINEKNNTDLLDLITSRNQVIEAVMLNELKDSVRLILSKMDKRYGELVKLRLIEELSFREIGKLWNVSCNAVHLMWKTVYIKFLNLVYKSNLY